MITVNWCKHNLNFKKKKFNSVNKLKEFIKTKKNKYGQEIDDDISEDDIAMIKMNKTVFVQINPFDSEINGNVSLCFGRTYEEVNLLTNMLAEEI